MQRKKYQLLTLIIIAAAFLITSRSGIINAAAEELSESKTVIQEEGSEGAIPEDATESSISEDATESSIPEDETVRSIPEGETVGSIPEEETEREIPEDGDDTEETEVDISPDNTPSEPQGDTPVEEEKEPLSDTDETDAAEQEILSSPVGEKPLKEELASEKDEADLFVEDCYMKILGRTASEAEIKKKADAIRSGNITAGEILYGFFFSAEYLNKDVSDQEYVDTLYKAVLNRNADSTGRAGRLKELEYGFTRRYLLQQMVSSGEFAGLCGEKGLEAGTVRLTDTLDKNPAEAKYVYELYKNILSRKPDRKGQISNVEYLLANGAKPLIVRFFRSGEYTGKKDKAEDFIRKGYLSSLRRNAEASAVTSRKEMLDNGLSEMYVLRSILNSAKFSKKTSAYGVKEGTFPANVLEMRDKNPTITKYVMTAYKNGLNRKAGPAELNKRAEQMILKKQKAYDLLYDVAFSKEASKKAPSDQDFVKMVFKLILQRNATDRDVKSYTETLSGLISRQEMFDRVAFSRESVKVQNRHGYSIKDKYNDMYLNAATVLDSVGWDLKKGYDWIVEKTYKWVGVLDSEDSRWHADYFFSNLYGDCYAMAGALYEMAKAMGYEVHQMYGSVVEPMPHSWIEIVVKGDTYVCDPDFENELQLNGYMITYGQKKTLKYNIHGSLN